MNVNLLIDELLTILDNSWGLPLTGGRAVVDADKVKETIDKIRDALPNELKHARAIVADRTQIINDAKKEAEGIIKEAEEKAKVILSQSEIVKRSVQQAEDVMQKAQGKSRSLKKATNEYIEEILKNTDELLAKNLIAFRKDRQNIRSSQKN